jgi:hypothetical protein
MFNNKEREVISVFLHDLYHHKAIMAKMREITKLYEEEELQDIVYALKDNGTLNKDELNYLLRKISRLYARKP